MNMDKNIKPAPTGYDYVGWMWSKGWRMRFRRAGVTKYFPECEPGDEVFQNAYEAFLAGQDYGSPRIKVTGAKPRSLGHAWQMAKETKSWRALEDSTRVNTQRVMEWALSERVADHDPLVWKDAPVAALKRGHVKLLLERNDLTRPGSGKALLAGFRRLLDVALDQDWIEFDPTRQKLGWTFAEPAGWQAWPYASMLKFEKRWDFGTTARTVYELCKWTGLRRSDLVRFRWEQLGWRTVDGEEVLGWTFKEFKGRKNAKKQARFVPYLPEIEAAVAHLPQAAAGVPVTERTGFVLCKADGSGYGKGDTITKEMREVWTVKAGLAPGHVLHGIRKSMGGDAADAGATMREGMAVLGHSTTDNFELYSRSADQARGTLAAVRKVIKLRERREEMNKRLTEKKAAA